MNLHAPYKFKQAPDIEIVAGLAAGQVAGTLYEPLAASIYALRRQIAETRRYLREDTALAAGGKWTTTYSTESGFRFASEADRTALLRELARLSAQLTERLAMMTSDLPQPIGVGRMSRFMAGPDGRRRQSFAVTAGDQMLAEVAIIPTTSSATQEQLDSFAGALQALLAGSEGRVDDAEARVDSLRQTVAHQRAEIEALRARLTDFETGRFIRGEAYAIEGNGGVWLAGKPSASAFGVWFKSWADLARERPGLRPCGTVGSVDKPVNAETYVVMRPVADL